MAVLTVFTVVLLLSISNALDCPAGTYISNGECNVCSLGGYQPEPNQRACLKCPYGTYADVRGSQKCKSCPKNHMTYHTACESLEDCKGPQLKVTTSRGASARYYDVADFKRFEGKEGVIEVVSGRWILTKSSGQDIEVNEGDSFTQTQLDIFTKGKPIITNDFCYTGTGRDYQGTASISEYLVQCLNWNDVPSMPHYNPNHNYCRNFGTAHDEPWCFVPGDMEPKAVRCKVPKCVWDEKCKSTPSGDKYKGNTSWTDSGWECQNWESDYPHPHGYNDVGNHNYCRNPGNEQDGLWCYTKAVTFPIWDYCTVPVCDPAKDSRYEYDEF